MKKSTPLLLISFLITFSCKEIHNENIKAKNEAIEELRVERLENEIKTLDYLLSKYPKSESEITQELSLEQKKIMDSDKAFIFSHDENIGNNYSVLKELKFDMTEKESEINGKYKLYLEAKKLNADGIVNYKVNYSPFFISGNIVKKDSN